MRHFKLWGRTFAIVMAVMLCVSGMLPCLADAYSEYYTAYTKLMETEWTWHAIRRLGVEVVASFFLGGFLLAIILTPIAYFTVKRLVVVYRARAEKKKKAAAA